MAAITALGSLAKQHERGLRAERMRFRVDTDLMQVDSTPLRKGDSIKEGRSLLNLRRGRAETLTKRIHTVFCALAVARVRRPDGWLSIEEIGQLEGWSSDGSVAKLLVNEFELGSGALGIVEQKGRGAEAQLRLRMPAALIEIGVLPDTVRRLFGHERETLSTEDVRPQPIVERELALALADALRSIRLGDLTLLVSPLYQGGHSSLVFGGIAVHALGPRPAEPAITSVLVKIPIGLNRQADVVVHDKALHDEISRLEECAGWPGLPVRVERVQADLRLLASGLAKKYGLDFREASPVIPVLIAALGRPRTVESAPRLLSGVLNETIAPGRRLTRRDLHNVFVLAERLATLTRLFHRKRLAHRHLSVDAIVVRYELGVLSHVIAADLAASVPASGSDELLYRDLFDLGRVLVHVITGLQLSGDRQNFQPPGFPGRAQIKSAVVGEGETVARLLFAVSRYLLEPSSGENGQARDAPTVKLLDLFLDEIEHIEMLHWSRARGVPERRVSPSIGGGVALSSNTTQREVWARSATDPIATRLVTISQLVEPSILRRWCERYVTSFTWYASIASPGGMVADLPVRLLHAAEPSTGEIQGTSRLAQDRALTAEQCIAILQQGFGRSAANEMWTYLWKAEPTEPVANLTRVLRNYVTHWLREARFDVPHPIDDESSQDRLSDGLRKELDALHAKFSSRSDGRLLTDWLDELRRRSADFDESDRPSAKNVVEERLRSWMHAGALTRLLRAKQKAPTEKDIFSIENALRGRNSPETVFWHILLARAWVAAAAHGSPEADARDNESRWDKAMRTLLVAAGVAASRKLPFEMAATLAASAYLARVALSTPELCAEFASQGADDDSIRVQAAECALTAADAYLWLDNQKRHCRSLLEAVWLLLGSAFPERLVQAFQLLSLAHNNRTLDWQPPHIDWPAPSRDDSQRDISEDTRFERYISKSSDTDQLVELEHRLFNAALEAWAKSRNRIQTSGDPGTVVEHSWFSRYTSSNQPIFGLGGLRIDPAVPVKSCGGVVRRLLALAEGHDPEVAPPGKPTRHRILDFGCGAGDEAWSLARDHDVWAVDSPMWFAASHRDANRLGRAEAEAEARPRFIAWDPVDYAERILSPTLPSDSPKEVDVVLFRYSLCRVSQRDKLLAAAFKLLKPGGLVLVTDWVQARTSDRITWSRLLNTMRVVGLETEPGYRRLCGDARLTDPCCWTWEDVAGAKEPSMRQYFQTRLEEIRRKLSGERSDDSWSPCERAALLRAQRDLEVLTAMSAPQGPLGWIFWTARKPLVSQDDLPA